MKTIASKNGFSVRAISGTRAVILAMNSEENNLKNFLGFGIGRKSSDRIYWLKGFKCFKDLVPDPSAGQRFSTTEHPVQDFRWGHYYAEPDTEYTYVVRPLFKPESNDFSNLRRGTDIEIKIRTESETTGKNSVLFNRGAIVSQAYADNFDDDIPSDQLELILNDPENPRTKWLSRGLLEGILGFIGQATDSSYSLHCCFYEISYSPVITALVEAGKRGAKVEISYEAGHYQISGNVRKETKYGISNKDAITPYLNSKNMHFKERIHHVAIPHNKFIILCKNNRPVEVWTGSTNISSSGFLGQSNTGHIVRDVNVAGLFFEYFNMVAKDSLRKDLRAFCETKTPNPGDTLPEGTTVIFSPRRGTSMLDWYGSKAFNAKSSLIFTSAFGVSPGLSKYFDNQKEYLRYILMEQKSRGIGVQDILEKDPNTRIVLGQGLGTRGSMGNWRRLPGWNLENWMRREVHFRTKGYVFFVHTKYMAIDVMDNNPTVFTGSANFSPNSLHSNDENMLLIQGDSAVSDVYTVEFFRLQTHFYFRQVANRMSESGTNDPEIRFLDPTDSWVKKHFTKGNYRYLRREMMGAPVT
ncbi:phospholipase D-like domain-containing protein [Aquiflexum lacus]|uniref:phospholipase D-like domain-containing protein n=1 Tax=Aquiflexum lacus TaxID=2483805 RepID=UPI0018933121|nr:phospholipase D-like domain-containing protein [Aquiflexum lacus]